MPGHPYAVEERPGSVGMPSWGAPAIPQECPERPGGTKTMLRSGPSHPRVTKNVVNTPPDTENLDFLKIDVSLSKNIGFRGRRRPKLTQRGPQTLPSGPQTAQNADCSTQRCKTAQAAHL